jgi:hypothetical protein
MNDMDVITGDAKTVQLIVFFAVSAVGYCFYLLSRHRMQRQFLVLTGTAWAYAGVCFLRPLYMVVRFSAPSIMSRFSHIYCECWDSPLGISLDAWIYSALGVCLLLAPLVLRRVLRGT